MKTRYEDFVRWFKDLKKLPAFLTYNDAVNLGAQERNIKYYILNNYSSMVTDSENPLFSMKVGVVSVSGLPAMKRIMKFAEEKDDKELIRLIDDYLEVIKDIQLRNDVKKYNL